MKGPTLEINHSIAPSVTTCLISSNLKSHKEPTLGVNPSAASSATTNALNQFIWRSMISFTLVIILSVAHSMTTNSQQQAIWIDMKEPTMAHCYVLKPQCFAALPSLHPFLYFAPFCLPKDDIRTNKRARMGAQFFHSPITFAISCQKSLNKFLSHWIYNY